VIFWIVPEKSVILV